MGHQGAPYQNPDPMARQRRPYDGGGMQGNPGDFRGYPPGYPHQKRDNGNTWLIAGIIAVAVAILGAGCWWYFGYRDSHPIVTEDDTMEEAVTTTPMDDTTTDAGDTSSPAAPLTTTTTPAQGQESPTLFNRPLTYTGTVTPGGVASLNIMLFQNGRLEGSIDYSDGKSMPLFGSYTWADDGHMINLNFTVSSDTDKTYSESWMGTSSHIKDDLAHTITFKRIHTSTGRSMTASFALRN